LRELRVGRGEWRVGSWDEENGELGVGTRRVVSGEFTRRVGPRRVERGGKTRTMDPVGDGLARPENAVPTNTVAP
jgi:hypothetical protein